jgi:hypothetical protein
MKKSLSAPNLVSLPHVPVQGSSLLKRKSTSHPALPPFVDAVTDAVTEWQIESVFKVSAVQAGSCGMSLHTFPYEIVMKPDAFPEEKVKDMAVCLSAPPEKDELVLEKVFRSIGNASYLEMTEVNERISDRFATLLQRVRRSRRNWAMNAPLNPSRVPDLNI